MIFFVVIKILKIYAFFVNSQLNSKFRVYKNKEPDVDAEIELYKYSNNQTFVSKGYSISYKQLLKNNDYNFILEKAINLENVNTIRMGEIISYTSGIKTANDEKFILNEKKDDDCYLFLRGRNIKK